jgi:hypothetical protein
MGIATVRGFRDRAGVGVLAIIALAICATSASAATKDYSLTIAPSTVPAGRLVDMAATFTNRTAQQRLGSANLTPPQGYVAASVTSLSRPAPATATIVGGVVQLRGLDVPPGGTATVVLKVSTPCSAPTASVWSNVIVKQSNDFNGSPGNNLTLDPPTSSLTTTTTGACTVCPEDTSCTAKLGGPAGSSSVVTSDPSAPQPDAGLLTIQTAVALDCAGYVERSPDTFVTDAPPNRPKNGLLTFASNTRPIKVKDPLEVCYASPLQFTPKPNTLLTQAIIDGQLNFIGRLPDCIGFSPPPCVTGRNDTLRQIAFSMPTGDPRFS